MATLKYKLPSPYTTVASPPPVEDEAYTRHLQDLRLTSPSNNQTYGVAIFGIGRAGTIHLRNLLNNRRTELLYVVDDDVNKLQKIKNYYSINTNTTQLITSKDAKLVYQDPRVRFVVISSPTFTHEELIREALTNRKAVFCEKPIADNIESTVKMFQLAKQVNQPLFSAFNRRFDPSYLSLRNRVRAGEVGKVLTVKVHSRDSPLPTLEYLKISGGFFHDSCVHDIDQILFALGELPDKVVSFSHANIPEIKAIDDYDNISALLSFPSGANGIIDLNRHCTYGYEQRLEVFGEKGMLKAENKAALDNVEFYTEKGVSKVPIDYSFASRFKEAYEMEIEHFVEVLDGTTELRVTENTNLAVSKIATALEESARSGKIVHLTWTAKEAIN
ncbi:inositol 2-dehydrogenase-like [Rhynchophorus ferrugineus]|uniref:inositol 2-dehydrogenase-like n=1 Tax=Rhynchophorus ferrugineus TaxID=354439 RepID=UPI003FCE338B